ncbi:MAG: DNA mismatch repair endonuclease MutL [Clostridia bacterium]|nr:DNA mismatch repair endonuclease MutL [Clostridia bacterium]
MEKNPKKINILDTQTTNRIAAGEVVERPSSVVKELLENAIDAHADAVTLDIREGGIGYIRVSDNGVGIAPEDLRIAFERHATSKIHSGDPLDQIGTLGFRGEALPSIAAVSKVELTSRPAGAASGMRINIEGGQVLSVKQAGSPDGTTFIMRDLFYNTPARRKFLKRESTEAGYISDIVTQLALSRPDISFRFVNQGKTVFQTPGDGNLQHAMIAVHGKQMSGTIPVQGESGLIRISGYIGVGELGRGNRNYEMWYVNRRYIKNAVLSMALENACKGSITIGRFPYCVLFLDLPMEQVDVNVHPNKLEVRFRDEYLVHNAVQRILNEALYLPLRTIRENTVFNQDAGEKPAPSQGTWTQTTPAAPEKPAVSRPASSVPPVQATPKPAEDFFRKAERGEPLPNYPKPDTGREEGVHFHALPGEIPSPAVPDPAPAAIPAVPAVDPVPAVPVPGPAAPVQTEMDTSSVPSLHDCRILGTLFSTYILVQQEDTVYIIDQHAAHERLRYEELVRRSETHTLSQQLLLPHRVEVTLREKDAIEQNLPLFREIGFEIEPFEENSYRVSAVPVILGQPQISGFFQEVLDSLTGQFSNRAEDLRRAELIRAACHSAVKGGDRLEQAEIIALMNAIRDEQIPLTCPHGRPIYVTLTQHDLERRFSRIQG